MRGLSIPNRLSSAELQPGQSLTTEKGKAEILLTPGVFLRVGNNSSVRMISPSLTDTEVGVTQGQAMIEVAEIHPAEESIWAAVAELRRWIERYGVPQALYTDWKNVYLRPPNAGERMRGEPAVTQFGRMCAKLGIRIIAASSPQAKGRVERAHGTHQDRLVKKLRLAGIANSAETDYHRRRPNHATTGRSLLAGGRTRGQRGLGGALPEPAAATGTAQPAPSTFEQSRAGAGE